MSKQSTKTSTKTKKEIKHDISDEELETEKIPIIPKITKSQKKTTNTGIRDLDKIIEDPDGYANTVSIERLVTILQKMSDYYYAEGDRSLVDDDIYDVMVDVLKHRDPDNAFLHQTGVTKPSADDIELPYFMPSLSKIVPGEKALPRWFKTYNKGPYIIMDKLDGISVQIYKDNKGNIDLFTKKQTNMGTSKQHMLKYLVDKKILDKIPNGTSIRGEVVISKKHFEEVLEFAPTFKNERSVMSGLMGPTDKIDTRIASRAQLITYNILHPRYTLEEQQKKLKKWGFKVVWNKIYEHDDLVEENEENEDDEDEEEDNKDKDIKIIESNLKQILGDRISNSEFLIDGIVVYDDSEIHEHCDDNPKYAMAFKMNSIANMKEAVVEKVNWEPTMYGDLRPVVQIKPVVLSGNTTVTFCTAHNAKYIKNNNIGKGAIIKIVRSKDVIPYIVSVVKPAKEPDMPDMEYEWNDTGVQIMVINPTNNIKRIIKIKQNLHFFKKIGVKFLSEGLMTKLYNEGYKTILSIVMCADTKDPDPYKIRGLGEKMVSKIYDQIDKAFTKAKLPELMSGSLVFGSGIGVRKIKEIVKMYPNILDMHDLDEEVLTQKILKIKGFSEILTAKFVDNIGTFYEFLEEIRKNTSYELDFSSNTKKEPKHDDSENNVDMSKETVVMTGFRSEKITEFIENNGGKVTGSVSKNTTLVIYVPSDKGSSKIDKAKELGIKIMTRDEFEKKYNID